MLNANEKIRYSRHLRLSEVGIEGQEKLKNSRVLVIGAGGLGCPVLQYITAAGVGNIGIIDNDVVEISNLQRQVLFSVDDIEKPKSIIAKEKLSKLNENVKFKAYFERLTKTNILKILKNYDIIVDCSDNFPTRYLINDACVIENKALVYGAINKFDGQVSVFNYLNGPTLRCLSPEQPSSLDAPSCAEVGVIGVIPAIIGAFQANEVIKIILNLGEVLSGKLLIFDALTYSSNIISFNKQKNSLVKTLSNYDDFCLSDEMNVKKIDYSDLLNMVNSKSNLLIIDLRYPDEITKLDFITINIPIYDLPEKIDLIPQNIPVVFVCDYEIKSNMAVNYFQNKYNFQNVYSLKNGLAFLKR